MTKTIHPGPRPHIAPRGQPARTADRGRAGRAQSGKAAGVKKPGEVEEEDELDEGALSSGDDDDARREIGEQEARRFGAFRKDREDFDKKAEAEGQAGKPAEKSALAGAHASGSPGARIEGSAPAAPAAPTAPSAPALGAVTPVTLGAAREAAAAAIEQKLAAEMQKSANSNSKRSIYGAPLNKTPSTPAKTEAPAAPSTLKPMLAAKPLETAAAPRRPAPPPPAPAPSSAMSVPPTRVDARAVLSTGKPAGTNFKHFPVEQNLSPAVQGAVAEAQKLLAGMKGIGRVLADTYKGEPVVRIDVQQGLTREGMRAIPSKVQDVKTVINLPFDALPLRRSLGGK